MRRSTSRTLFALALVASAVAALRPDRRTERLQAVLFAPARLLAEMCAPVRWLRLRAARAAESALIERDAREHAARVELQELQRAASAPQSDELRAARRFVHAEVVERAGQHFDTLVVRLDGLDSSGLERGMPVAHGDDFVGRVAQLDAPQRGYALVELVTSREFAVGARLEALDDQGEPLRAVAGGLAAHSRRGAELRLALSTPSRRELPAVLARVDESLSTLAPFAAQSAGFRLGWVEASPRGEHVLAPALDLRGGPFRVSIVAPESIERPHGLAPYEPLSDPHWAPARVLARSVGEREGFVLSVGALHGVELGAAFVVGSRLIGRVSELGATHCAVASLGDRGWALPAVALPDDSRTPIALGNLVARGRASAPAGALGFEWNSSGVSAPGAGPLAAQVFTGSGAPGVPSGLWLGRTELPRESGRQLLRIDPLVELRSLSRGFVRLRGVTP